MTAEKRTPAEAGAAASRRSGQAELAPAYNGGVVSGTLFDREDGAELFIPYRADHPYWQGYCTPPLMITGPPHDPWWRRALDRMFV